MKNIFLTIFHIGWIVCLIGIALLIISAIIASDTLGMIAAGVTFGGVAVGGFARILDAMNKKKKNSDDE